MIYNYRCIIDAHLVSLDDVEGVHGAGVDTGVGLLLLGGVRLQGRVQTGDLGVSRRQLLESTDIQI